MNITGLPLEEKQKKKLILLLLLISCIISALLLAFTTHSSVRYLKNFEQADSLIVKDLERFNISAQQINIRSVRLDSLHMRKIYRVYVPPGFSKTQMHLELAQTFHSFGIQTPARVVFPYKDMIIHLVYQNTIIRSVELRTDPSLVLQRNYGSILIAFESIPTEEQLQKMVSFGEPIPLVLISDNPIAGNEAVKELKSRYSNVLLWLKDEEGNNVVSSEFPYLLQRLQRLQEVNTRASVLSFQGLHEEQSSGYLKLLARTSLSFVDVSEAILLDSGTGFAAFKQELNKFAQKAKRNERPVAIVRGNNKSLNWLQDALGGFKKAGLEIVLPRRKQF